MDESESESEVAQLCLTVSDPMDCSLPGSSVHGIFQARVLNWGAIAFSSLVNRKGEKTQPKEVAREIFSFILSPVRSGAVAPHVKSTGGNTAKRFT